MCVWLGTLASWRPGLIGGLVREYRTTAGVLAQPPDEITAFEARTRRRGGRAAEGEAYAGASRAERASDAERFAAALREGPAACLRRARRAAGFCTRFGYPLVVVNHHWHFFDSAGQPRPALVAAWRRFVAELTARNDVAFTTFAAYGASQ